MNTSKLEQLIRKLQWKHRNDPTTPAVHLSYLYREKMYYGSLIVYNQSFARGSKVIASCKRTTLEGVLVVLLNEAQQLQEPLVYDYADVADYGNEDDDIPF